MQRRQFIRAAGGGAAAAAATGTAAAQEADGEDGGGGGGTEVVDVGPDGAYTSFQPEELEVQPGTTVRWVWQSDGHNVAVRDQPGDAGWEGHATIEDAGFEYEHTFDVEGEYHYVCEPHINSGMEGWVTVTEDAGEGGGEVVGAPPTVPASALGLAIGLIAAMSTVLSLAFVAIKYGGRGEES